jgi:hypothetical protein
MVNIAGNWITGQVFINGLLLEPGPSQNLFNHSPDGFSWGYAGSGPAQLALAILLELTGDKEFALEHHQDFKFAWVAKLPQGDFLGWSKADEWIIERGGKVKNGYKLSVTA